MIRIRHDEAEFSVARGAAFVVRMGPRLRGCAEHT